MGDTTAKLQALVLGELCQRCEEAPTNGFAAIFCDECRAEAIADGTHPYVQSGPVAANDVQDCDDG